VRSLVAIDLLLAVDDTDNLHSRGTGFLCQQLLAHLQAAGLGTPLGATRHQLLLDHRIPYTSHNSSACIAWRTHPSAATEDLAATVTPLLATSRMKGYHATPILPLACGKVRYVGEPVVGVLATSRYYAEDALELIGIEFAPLPVVADPLEAVKDGAPRLHEEAGGNVIVSREFKRGDVDAALF